MISLKVIALLALGLIAEHNVHALSPQCGFKMRPGDIIRSVRCGGLLSHNQLCRTHRKGYFPTCTSTYLQHPSRALGGTMIRAASAASSQSATIASTAIGESASTASSSDDAKNTQTAGNNLQTGINRHDFPILARDAYPGKKLIYLDSGASSQKPIQVLDAMDQYYRTSHSNVHRGAHALANEATEAYESARSKLQLFINAKQREEIVFTRGATEAVNLVAHSYTQRLQPGDEVILSVMEHHANIVPWQLAAERCGIVLKFVQLTPSMEFDFEHFRSLLSEKTKIVSVAHASNVLGTVNPVREIIEAAHSFGAVVMLDACQSVPHMPVDVQALDVDFLVASAHKMCGPTGIGFLYAKYDILESMPPMSGGGEMIDTVELTHSTYAAPPSRFEAGTPAIAEAIGFGAACDYLSNIGMEKVHDHEVELGRYLYEQLSKIEGLKLYGPPTDRTGLVAFNSEKVHATDLSFFLDQEGVAVRTGHHCTQPLHKELGAAGSIRASLYLYNGREDVDAFIEKLKETLDMFESMQ